jgi:hypothetical protein
MISRKNKITKSTNSWIAFFDLQLPYGWPFPSWPLVDGRSWEEKDFFPYFSGKTETIETVV